MKSKSMPRLLVRLAIGVVLLLVLACRGAEEATPTPSAPTSYAHSLRPESTYSSYGDGNATSRCNSGANCNEHTIAGR